MNVLFKLFMNMCYTNDAILTYLNHKRKLFISNII